MGRAGGNWVNRKNIENRISLISLLLIALVFSCSSDPGKENLLYLQNGQLSLGFDKKTGSLRVFRDLTTAHDFLDENGSPGSTWKMDLLQSSGSETIDISTAQTFSYEKPDPLSLQLEWSKFAGSANENLLITVTVTLEEHRPLSTWKISLTGINGRRIGQVAFPRIAGIQDMGEERLAVPQWMGQILENPRTHLATIKGQERKYEWGYPGLLSMQCLALYNPDKCGFYASSNDSLAYSKNFSFSLDTLNNLCYQMHNYPALDSSLTSFELPYAAVVGSFKGDWITAAELYREWGFAQRWCRESRFKTGATPSWLENTALWVWNRGKSDNVLIPAAELQERLGLPVSVFWHWWHGCSYDDGFPEYIPPREGKSSFVSALSLAQDKGIHAIVYMNQVLWGTSTSSWKNENAAFHSAKNPAGETISHVFNIFTNRPLAYMCMATQFWKDKYASLCDSVVNRYHTNGVYMDMACLSLKCYDRNHGHPIGGGDYWVEHFGRLAKQIRSTISPKNQPILAGEGCAEAWLPYLDVFLTLAVSKERYAGVGLWETIPFFQAVYHQYAITYGNYSSLLVPPYDELWPKKFAPKEPLKPLDKSFNKQFLMEQARAFVWGMQPTIANYQSFLASERRGEIGYLIKLARTRNQGLKYLLHGKFLRSPDIEIPEEELDISRLSIYAGRRGESITTFRSSYPLIYSGTWQAADNDIGIALASISDDPFRVNCSLSCSDYSLPPAGNIFIIDGDGKKLLTRYANNKIHLDFTMRPKGLCIVEISANQDRRAN